MSRTLERDPVPRLRALCMANANATDVARRVREAYVTIAGARHARTR